VLVLTLNAQNIRVRVSSHPEIGGPVGGRIDGWIDGWMDGWMDGDVEGGR
jgi:hypothetical protein